MEIYLYISIINWNITKYKISKIYNLISLCDQSILYIIKTILIHKNNKKIKKLNINKNLFWDISYDQKFVTLAFSNNVIERER